MSDDSNERALSVFYDNGSVLLSKRPSDGPDSNRRSLSGAGFGVSWSRTKSFVVRLNHAVKVGSGPEGVDNGFTWLRMIKYF